MNYPKLKKTWIFDLDGTLVVHRGYENGQDVLLDGITELLAKIPKTDMVVIITGRPEKDRKVTINNLDNLGIRYDHIIFDAGQGARIVVNDTKPSGYKTAHSFCVSRNAGININDLKFFMEL
jgi:ribonucleotide monophosphatase NagD (HAD superfamily)